MVNEFILISINDIWLPLQFDILIAVLSDEAMAVQTPRFTPDGKYLVWLQRPYGGPHHGAHAIVKYNWSTKEVKSLRNT